MKRFAVILSILALVVLVTGCDCSHEWSAATCNEAKRCRFCGQREGDALGHHYEDAGCESPLTCSRCGKTEGEPRGHTWKAAGCDQPKTCSDCGKTEGKPGPHQWMEPTCARPEWCALCQKTRGEALPHTWIEATCRVPKYCSGCAAVMAPPLGHSWMEASCEAPKTCSICAITEGEALNHIWSKPSCTAAQSCQLCGQWGAPALGHSWLDADCEQPVRCAYCHVTQGSPLGHQWQSATLERPQTCTVCGATEGLPVELDDRFDMEACILFFGDWNYTQITKAEELEIPGFSQDVEERITYRFGQYGALDKLTEIVDPQCYQAMLVAQMTAELYASLKAMGLEGEAAEAYMMKTYRKTVAEYIQELVEITNWEENMNFREQLVYYVSDGMLYVSEHWEDPFRGYTYSMEGDRLLLTEEGTGKVLELTQVQSN